MYDAIEDPYTYPGTTVLKNKIDLRIAAELDQFEAEIALQRSDEDLPDGELDFAHFCAVHRHLFQDVYEWAGIPRTVRISKGGNPFCFPEHIVGTATKLFARLKSANFFKELDKAAFAKEGAHFLAELNAIHAFREGNGRTQLTFFALLADSVGHTLDFDKLDPDAMLRAMIASFDGDEAQLQIEILTLLS